jgi:polyvinyl alcohol dehydrogenase (cytochrome)
MFGSVLAAHSRHHQQTLRAGFDCSRALTRKGRTMKVRGYLRAGVVLPALAIVLLGGRLAAQTTAGLGQWRIAGHDLNNSRFQPSERIIGVGNVGQLVPKWVFTTGGDVSATPTVAGNTVYFPDWAGNLFAVRADTGQQIWSAKIADYNGRPGSISRVSPAIFNDQLILGDNMSASVEHNGAHVFAVDRNTGALRWITQVDSHPAAIITGSPVFNGNIVYVGVSSGEEALAIPNTYQCCTFRGSMVALNATTGAMLWKTYTVPDNEGAPDRYSGGAIWSPPAIDPGRGVLYIATGNNYTVPQAALDCQQQAIDTKTPNPNCTAPDDYFNTVLALNLTTGAIKWARKIDFFDAWTVACLTGGTNCPAPAGPDFDFPGSGPNLLSNILGVGQKSGIYWALNPNDGSIIWHTKVGPGGTTGGIQWGTATDGKRIYVAINNPNGETYTLANGGPTIDYGSWAALDPRTGRILWQVPDPTVGAIDPGAVSTANGVVYAGSYSGKMHALNASTGQVLFTFPSGGSVIDAPSIVNGTLYWGSGYGRIGGSANNKVYAFTVPRTN